jgi:hypothetical protein
VENIFMKGALKKCKFSTPLVAIVFMASEPVLAIEESSNAGTVARVLSYTVYGNGDVAVSLSNVTGKTCEGYWLNKADSGFQANLAMLVAAYHTKNTVQLYGETTSKWAGTNAYFCHLRLIDYRP